ncbi:hypothetical protein SEA_EASTWEST_11 [Arthrobacter phage EastWest]|uniref:Uncharacterized protein n=1 Tax=Arthrobacter phage EastWest TaxID=2894292 RepID=A0AAE8YK21_9CAUD|nr:hypothetical protein SEA_EASTWEST_11 [Arthrobacter phage EastWest]
MAARRTTRTASAAKSTEEETGTQASTVESDLSYEPKSLADFNVASSAGSIPDEDVEALKAADAAEEEPVAEEQVEVADQLRKKFIEGEDAPVADEPAVAELDTSNPRELGGDVLVVVLFDYYRLRYDGVFVVTRKGEVLKVSEKEADRGVSIGGLHKIED